MQDLVSMETVFLAGAVFLLVGLILLKVGLHRRRRGSTPHCRECDYILIGLHSERCPECGTEITAETTVYGKRTRWPVVMAIGLLCMAAGIASMIGAGRQIRWYGYMPTFLIIQDLDSADTSVANRAWAELRRRESNLTESQRARVIEMGLQQQDAATPCPAQQEFIQFVTRCLFRGQLTEAQKVTFFEQMVTLDLMVPSVVVQGQEVDYGFAYDLRGPSRYSDEYLQIRLVHGEVRVDGTPRYEASSYSTVFNDADMRSTSKGRTIGTLEPGPHEILIKPTVVISHQRPGGERDTVYQKQLELGSDFKVVGAEEQRTETSSSG